jgi:hypothetical protein
LDAEGYFQEPVADETDAPGYFTAITHPMDFRTMLENLTASHNITWLSFTVCKPFRD